MRRSPLRTLAVGAIGSAALALLSAAPGCAHSDVPLKGYDGATLDPASSAAPYSPKNTCGGCHSYETITRGYHFQQGFDEGISDTFSEEKPWQLSPGMVGKW
ncbi:MAG: hypothetical protein IH608_04545 [Proteobacteria bacterium]|nr:hypothetical protein [Pseudomonadota bacterium]